MIDASLLLSSWSDPAQTILWSAVRWTPLWLAAFGASRLLDAPRDRKRLWLIALMALPLLPILAELVPSWSLPDWRASSGFEVSSPLDSATTQVDKSSQLPLTSSPSPEASPLDLPSAASFVWLFGLLFLLGRELTDRLGAWATCRSSSPAPTEVRLEAEAVASSLGVRSFEVRLADVLVPVLCCTWAPRVLLPAAATLWPVKRLRAALLHELAHQRAGDPWLDLWARTVTAVFWFHPATWLAKRELRREMELVADATAVTIGSRDGLDAHGYGLALLDIAHHVARHHVARDRVPGLAMARQGGLEARLRALVRPARQASATRRLILASLFALVASAVAAATPAVDAWLESTEHGFRLRCGDDAVCRSVQQRADELLGGVPHRGVLLVERVATGEVMAYSAKGPAPAPLVPPASIAKLAIAALWWDADLGDRSLPCPKTWHGLDGIDLTAVRDLGEIDVPSQMLVTSCTTAAGAMFETLSKLRGGSTLERQLADFGFAPRTGSEWLPSWSPSPRLDPGAAWESRRPEMAAALGRVSTTPLHVASFVQAIGLDGLRLAVRRPGESPGKGERLMSASTAERLRQAMAAVVTEGTGRQANKTLKGSPWHLLGKTGTRQRDDGAYDGWFAGLATDAADRPQYVVVAFLDGEGMGSGTPTVLAAEMTRFLAQVDRE